MHPLWQKIAALQRRLIWRRRAAAVCAIAATTIAVAFALGTADYLVRFTDRGLRIMATLAFFTTFVWAVYRWAYAPRRRPLAPLTVARRIEQRFPQLKDSLASAVEFLAQSEEDPTSGSAQLRRLVVGEAQNTVDGLNLDEVIDRRPLRRAATWFAAVTVLVSACAVWNAGVVTTALARLVAPFGNAEWHRKHYLAFRDVPTRLAAGQTFEVTLVDTAGSLPDDVRIEYRITGRSGTERFSEPMIRAGDKMLARRENVRQSFAFRAVGGDDRAMSWHSIEVIEPPRLESLSIVVHSPAYSALPAVESDRHLEVLAGSTIEVRGMANEPLGTARILFDGTESIAADLLEDKTGNGRAFHIAPGKWIAAKSGPYRLELAGLDGLGGVVGSWNLRVQPDPPPTAIWVRPTSELYVTAEAVVPIEVIVKDNLAIQRVELVYERFGHSESAPSQVPMEAKIELYRGPDKAASQSTRAPGLQGDSQTVAYAWDLAPLDLPVGAQFGLHAEAADYRPVVGRTPTPRRITVISVDELEARLADFQTQIVRQLERALSLQRSTREEVRGLQIQLDDTAALESSDRNTLRTGELNQRRVTQSIVDPAEGVPALMASLLEQVAINRVSSADDVRASMSDLEQEIERLSAGPLKVAERELLAATKSVDDAALPIEGKAIAQFLSAAGGAQDTVIATLERLIHELSGPADYRQLARELVELRQDQLAHADAARAEIGVETLPLQISELTSSQRTVLNKAAAGQSAIARRYEKIERAMEGVTGQLSENDGEARAASEAVELARDLAIGAQMRETVRDLSENRVGQALALESQIADKLQQVINALRGQNKGPNAGLAEDLREAENQLAAIREDTVALRQQLAETEGQGNAASTRKIEQLKSQQDLLQRDIEQLASQLNRLQASDAGQSARSAARRFDNRHSNTNRSPSQPPRPASSAAAEAAEQDLEQAAQQLANRRQQAEDDLALEFIRRFQAELAEMVKRQQNVLNDTIEIEGMRDAAGARNYAAVSSVVKLADEEGTLALLAREHSELLYGLAAVRISLEDAERRLDDAAKLLKNGDTGPSAQRAERHALARLEGMLEAFAQMASEAAPNNPAEQPQPQAAQQTQQPRRRPTFELLEVKMLRMLQVDLNERTRQFKASVEGLAESASEDERTDLSREARRLHAEQGNLSKLVDEMLNRDNEQGGQ